MWTSLAWIGVQVVAGLLLVGVVVFMSVFGWIVIGDFVRAWRRKPWT